MLSRRELVLAVVGLAVAVYRRFDAFGVLYLVGWSIGPLFFSTRVYRLITRGRTWSPSKDPADYRS